MSATTATRISPAFEDIDAVLGVIRSAGPFWPLSHYAGNHGNEQPYEAVRVHVYFLDGEVESTLSAIRNSGSAEDAPASRSQLEKIVLDSPLLPIQPWQWSWFDQ